MLTAIVSILYYAVVLAWSLVYFVFMLVLFLLTVLFDKERVVLHKASRFWAFSIFWLNPLWRLKIEGRDNVDQEGAYVVTVNHQSMVDIPLMYVLPKINFKWVSKAGIYKWPIFGVVLWLHGDITIKEGSVRTAKGFMDKGLQHIKAGTSIVIFPEGTRSKDGEIRNFKEGAFVLAREAGVPVLPCVIDGAKTFIKGWRVRKNTFTVRILKPVPAAEVEAMPTRELMSMVRSRTVEALADIRTMQRER